MDKKQLDSILEKPYNPTLWRQILTDVFGARNLNQTPQPIMLLSDSKGVAESAFELGFFNTTDDRIIGLYEINLTNKPQIWRNRVALRELLRNIYKYDVDGALVVFIQNDKWRLSFISEIRVLNDDGTIDKRATEPKRYTYLLGKGEKTKTPTDRLSLLTNKKIALEDIRASFSVEALNNEFYKQISEYFYQIVGATTTKGKKTEVRAKIMNLPGVAADDRKTYQEFAVRLIGRTVFCWFLREKCSEQGKPLLPEKLLSSEAVRANKNYYHDILEALFFQTLNTPMKERIEDLPDGCEVVPFLNGGLFEPQIEDFYNSQSKTGNFQNYALKIPDSWFEQFFTKLEEYNFTIDENSPTEVEISVDPEMLGRIFENLLAEIDPDSGETARKATGSFYTPREIVNYMVDESLLIYLKSKLNTETVGFQAFGEDQTTLFGNEMRVQQTFEMPVSNNRWQGKTDALEAELRKLFAYSETENPFNETETEILVKAIDNCKILDPACGSGAFPIGVLQRLVHLLGKLDADNVKWKQWLKARAIGETGAAYDEGDVEQRNTRLTQISEAFAKDSSDFGRKLFLIENCIYGVDIQPIAAEISKLRCFLTLIVDDTIDEDKPNRGVNPLPNLEFKFVTADALLKLPDSKQISLFNSDTQIDELTEIRHEYIHSYGATKEASKFHFQAIQKAISRQQDGSEFKDERAVALSEWNPFGHEKVDWFDSRWMFGVKAFDIVIGNPPYIRQEKIKHYKTVFAQNYKEVFSGTADILVYFYALGHQLLREKGTLTFITSNKFYRANYGENLRKFLSQKSKIKQIIDFGDAPVFEAAAYASINILQKDLPNGNKARVWTFPQYEKVTDFQSGFNRLSFELAQSELIKDSWHFEKPEILRLLENIKSKGTPLGEYVKGRFYYGIKTGFNEAFVVDQETRDKLIAEHQSSRDVLKPYLRGRDVKRWKANNPNLWLVYIPWHFPLHTDKSIKGASIKAEKEFERSYPAIFRHLLKFKDELSARNTSETGIRYEWYALQRFGADSWREFEERKIMIPAIERKTAYAIDETGFFSNDKTSICVTDEPQFLTAILNSSVLWWFIKQTASSKQNGYFEFKPMYVSALPIPEISKEKQKPFENLVDYILFLKETDEAEQVNEYVPNSHLVEQFEEVIDALVYELYFEEDFQKAEISFLNYAMRDFPPIENSPRLEKIKIIHAAYQTLRQKDGEIRNNLKLMDIRLADLIMPIKTAR